MKRKIERRPVRRRRLLGKAGKRRTLRVVVPRIGDLVAIRWVDSGFFAYRTPKDHGELGLDMIVTYGVVVYRNGDKTILASEHSDDMDDTEGQLRNVIWNKAITGCVILRKGGTPKEGR